MSCCICSENGDFPNKYLGCSEKHKICKTCYKRVLSLCYCRRNYGEILYTCPICKHEKYYKNIEMVEILNTIYNNNVIYLYPHKICQRTNNIPNIIRKCKFENCGCRKHLLDLKDIDEPFDEIIEK